MIIGFAKETFPGERRVALIPSAPAKIKQAGFEYVCESNAGLASGHSDADYVAKGFRIVESRREVIRQSDVILYVRGLGADPLGAKNDLAQFRRGQVIIGMFDPANSTAELKALSEIGVTAFALELLPRVTRAQSMDVLSSMATIAGYKAVLLAANVLPKMFPLLMTAAGTISPANVFIVGAGVAGLQAIATAKRLGAVIQAYDVRPAVKEQIESLGGKFVELPLDTNKSDGSGGYAAAMDEEFYRRQRELMSQIVSKSDVVISTAAIPGKRAPLLITADMVRLMKPGSVIVDLAAEQGGNCELTKPGETIMIGEVTLIGPINITSTVPFDASQMYSRNIANFLAHLADEQGNLKLDSDDQIIRATLATQPLVAAPDANKPAVTIPNEGGRQ